MLPKYFYQGYEEERIVETDTYEDLWMQSFYLGYEEETVETDTYQDLRMQSFYPGYEEETVETDTYQDLWMQSFYPGYEEERIFETDTYKDLWMQLHTQKHWPLSSVGGGCWSNSIWASFSISDGGVRGSSRSIYWQDYIKLTEENIKLTELTEFKAQNLNTFVIISNVAYDI